MAEINSQTDRLPAGTYPNRTFKNDSLVAAQIGAANASTSFDQMKADIIANITVGAIITRIKIIVTTEP